MSSMDLKTGRLAKGLSQVEAAGRLKVSQSYLAMLEGGVRRMTPDLARRAMRVYDLAPTALPPSELNVGTNQTASETLAGDLAALGYPGLAYLRPRNWKPKNPGEVLLSALAREDLESRLVEALPWLVLKFWPLDHNWLVREAKLRDLRIVLALSSPWRADSRSVLEIGLGPERWRSSRRCSNEAVLLVRTRCVGHRCPRQSGDGWWNTGLRKLSGGMS